MNKITVFIDHLDQLLFEQQISFEDIYAQLKEIIDQLNDLIKESSNLEDSLLDPAKGDVLFGSSSQGWAFDLKVFAEMYTDKFKIEVSYLNRVFWEF